MKASGARGSGLHAMTEKVREPPEHGGACLGGHPVDCRKGRFHRLLPPALQRFGALGGRLGVSVRNCWAYSAFSRCQPDFMASPRTMGALLRSRSSTSKEMCHPAAPHEMNRRSMLCHRVKRVPSPKASSSHRRSWSPQVCSSTSGASARFTIATETFGVGVPSVV